MAEACLNDFPWNRKELCGFGAENARERAVKDKQSQVKGLGCRRM